MAPPLRGSIIEHRRKRGTVYSARFRAYGKRRLVVLDKTTRAEAETELQNIIADVRRGIWRPRERTPVPVEATEEEPTFHVFASEWLEEHRLGLRPRSVEALKWALTYHLLPYFAHHKLSAITRREVDRYRRGKLREREEGLVPRPLSDRCINKTISILAQILDDAIEADLIETNPAGGRKRRLRAGKPHRNILGLGERRARRSRLPGGERQAEQPQQRPHAHPCGGDRAGEREAGRGGQAADPVRRHEPRAAPDVRQPALRGGGEPAVCDGADGPHERCARA